MPNRNSDQVTGWAIGGSIAGRDFSALQRVQTKSLAQPDSYSMGKACYFPGVKRPEREADLSPPSRVEVKNEYSYYFKVFQSVHYVRKVLIIF